MSDQLLRREQVEQRTTLSCSAIYRLMRAGQFPEPVQIGPRAVRWRSNEIEDYINTRPRASGAMRN